MALRRSVLAGTRRQRRRSPVPAAPGDSATAAAIPNGWELLRHLTSLVAGDATDDEVFAAVDRALAHVASADFSVLIRFEPDDGLAVVALDGSAASTEPALLPLLEAAVVRSLRAVGRPERWNDLNLAEKLPFITGSRPATRCALAVPIQTGISSWGLEVLVADQEDAFGGVTDELFTDALDVIRPMLAWSEASRDLRHVELERAQLRRVAEVAASATDLEELFVALTRAASAVLHGHPTSLVCYDDDAHGILVATHGGGAVAGDIGTPSAVSVPIMVGRQVWGSLAAGSIGDSLPLDAEERLSMFVGIMAAWIESAQVRDDLAAMADEQAALRRVAELMVLDVSQEKLFDAVASQAAELVNECTTLVRVDNETSCTVVGVGRSAVATGTRIAVSAERGLVAQVCRTRSPARVDDHPTHPGRAEASNQRSLRSSVGVPVIVSNKVWGVLGCTSWEHRLRPGTERRLEQFAALVAAALANAEARAHVQNLADEQSALRRVADLAALEAPAEEVMQAVADEAARLSGVEFTSLLRFGGDGSSSVVSLAGAPNGIAVGMRAPLKGEGAIPQVWRTARPARIDDLSQVRGGWAEVVADRGFSATVAVPIFIRGHLWGVLVVVSTDRPLPAGTEDHLVNFAELAGTGISAAQARVELRAVAEEQTALRRVAELVARGAPLEQVLAATAREASTLMRGLAAALMQYGGDEEAVVVAASNSPAPVGLRVPLTPDTGTGLVKQTGKPHRVDDFATTSLAAVAADLGIVGAVTVPVIVEGTVWGMLSTTSAGPPIPPETESRLTQFAELAAAAIAAAQNKNALLASRRRVLTTADETRRRVQRDVHDGAQQQLVHTIINLKLAREAMTAGDGQAERLITEALRSAERASQELRDLVHGILPAALTLGGLRRGVVSLADDLTLPVSIRVEAPRLSTKLETTAYFVVAEALTNVVKHARAGHARVDVVLVGDVLVIDVVDDGAGGADAASGTGLTGLQDRVQASDGILTVSSPPGGGTHLQARIPVTEPND